MSARNTWRASRIRAIDVALTEKGWACAHAAEEIVARLELRCAGLLGAERLQAFRVDLYRLALLTNDGMMPTRLRPIW